MASPDMTSSSAPGGSWNWLLGVLAGGLVTIVLVFASRRLIGKGGPPKAEPASADPELDEDYNDRLRNNIASALHTLATGPRYVMGNGPE